MKNKNLLIAISTKKDGSMKLNHDLLRNKSIEKNRIGFFKKIKIDQNLVVNAKLIHGNKVKIVTKQHAGELINDADGLITNKKNLFLSITVADCLPLFFYDSKHQTIALIHAGWKSLAKNILGNAVQKFIHDFQSKPEDVFVEIGPGISKCHFEVKNDVFNQFKKFTNAISKRDGKKYLDLKTIAKEQLINYGIEEKNMTINPECTYCLQDKYFSYRRDKPKDLETMMVIFGML